MGENEAQAGNLCREVSEDKQIGVLDAGCNGRQVHSRCRDQHMNHNDNHTPY